MVSETAWHDCSTGALHPELYSNPFREKLFNSYGLKLPSTKGHAYI